MSAAKRRAQAIARREYVERLAAERETAAILADPDAMAALEEAMAEERP